MLPKSIEEFSPSLQKEVSYYASLYKHFIRPLLPTYRAYYHGPVNGTDGMKAGDWFAMEFTSVDRKRAWDMFIQLSNGSRTYQFRPRGLDPTLTYQMLSENTGQRKRMQGSILATDGITVRPADAVRSELLLFCAG